MPKTQSYELSSGGGGSGAKSERGEWGNQVEFILACVGYSVGLGNLWRFPYLTYENGGGVFLIPYAISLVIAGLPMYYLELVIGQYSSLGPNSVFGSLSPIFQGVGWAMVIVSFVVGIYYNMVIAWTSLYLFISFRKDLLWGSCTNDWNTVLCQSNLEDPRCVSKLGAANESEIFFFNKTCYWMNNTQMLTRMNETFNATARKGPAEEFFNNYVYGLQDVNGFYDMGGIQWRLALALLFAWVIVFLCLVKGVKSTGKVVYFTATFPYVVLVIFFFRGITLKGAGKGIHFYMTPQYHRLLDVNVWRNAATQIFYSLGLAFGSLLTMASYNRFGNNCCRDAVLVAVINCCTSIFAGFAIFSTLGFMAQDLGLDVADVVTSGPSLTFIAFPEAIVRMPVSPVWSVLFFFMLLTLGLDSQFAMIETIITAMTDQFPSLHKRKWLVVAAVAIILYLLGLTLCTKNGIYLFTIFDKYSGSFSLLLIALSEFITVCYVYGIGRITKDIGVMLGVPKNLFGKIIGPTSYYFVITWAVVAPVYVVILIVFSFIHTSKTDYSGYVFPEGAEILGWCLSFIPIVAVPVWAIGNVVLNRIRHQPFMEVIRATEDWCPASERESRKQQAFTVTMKPIRPQLSQPPSYNNVAFKEDGKF